MQWGHGGDGGGGGGWTEKRGEVGGGMGGKIDLQRSSEEQSLKRLVGRLKGCRFSNCTIPLS